LTRVSLIAAAVIVGTNVSCSMPTREPAGVGPLPGKVETYSLSECYEAKNPVIDGSGRVWIVNDNTVNTICYLSSEKIIRTTALDAPFDAKNGLVDTHGTVWISGCGDESVGCAPELLRISAFGRPKRIKLDSPMYPEYVAIGLDNSIWLSGMLGGKHVTERLDIHGKKMDRRTFSRADVERMGGRRGMNFGDTSFPSLLAATTTGNGDVWSVDQAGTVAHLTTKGIVQHYVLPHGGGGPVAIAYGSDGRLWITESDGDRIVAITTSGVVTEYLNPKSPGRPTGILAGHDGSLWIVSATRLDENTDNYSEPYLIHLEP
jgi:streptogramin lyase